MAAPQRIYVVREAFRMHARLVRAPNAAQALRHVASQTLEVEVASQQTLVDLVAAGTIVEDSGRADVVESPELAF